MMGAELHSRKHQHVHMQTYLRVKHPSNDSPLQTGTHFPRLKNREWSSFVKQMSDAAGVLSNNNKKHQTIAVLNLKLCLLTF